MERKDYSAGAVKFQLWFPEFKKTIKLLDEGKTFDDIKTLALEENLYETPTTERAKQIFNTTSARIKMLDPSFYSVFLNGDISTQKICCLIAAMAHDTLFFDLVYEVIREKLIIGSNEVSDTDIKVFFKNKQQQDEKASKWTDMTIKNLTKSYKSMLYSAGVLDKAKDTRHIFKPILEISLEYWLKDNGYEPMIKALTGVR